LGGDRYRCRDAERDRDLQRCLDQHAPDQLSRAAVGQRAVRARLERAADRLPDPGPPVRRGAHSRHPGPLPARSRLAPPAAAERRLTADAARFWLPMSTLARSLEEAGGAPNVRRGMLLMISGLALFSVLNGVVKFLAETFPVNQIIFFRNFFA